MALLRLFTNCYIPPYVHHRMYACCARIRYDFYIARFKHILCRLCLKRDGLGTCFAQHFFVHHRSEWW